MAEIIFDEPPPNKDDFRIPEIRTDGIVVTWTAKEAFEGKCDLDQIDQVKYCKDHAHITRNMVYWREDLSSSDIAKTVGDTVSAKFGEALRAWEYRKREFNIKVTLDDFLLRGGSQLHGYTLIPQSKYAETASLAWQSRSVSSPIVVMSRGKYFTSERYVAVCVLTPEGKWEKVNIPAAELNDHGAKLRARLLNEGAIVSVDTEDRKRLLHFILNAQAFDQKVAA